MNFFEKLKSIFNVSGKSGFPKKKALVLEGGGMRGIFLTGVLQSFTDHGYFPWKIIAGSSAGALTGVAYAARQIHLARDAFFTRLIHEDFINLTNVLRYDKHILNLDWMIDTIINGEEPFNKAFLKKTIPVIITATHCGKFEEPRVIYLNSKKDDIDISLKATAAIPFLYKGFVRYKDYRLLDGGLLDPIPYKKALDMGYKEKDILVVVTRQKGYRKKDESFWVRLLYDFYFKDSKYRTLVDSIDNRFKQYNDILDELENVYKDIDVIYPPENFRVNRLTREDKIILEGFEQGVKAGREFLFTG